MIDALDAQDATEEFADPKTDAYAGEEAGEVLPDDGHVALELLDEGRSDNVRTSANKEEIEQLMHSILYHKRLLQPLVVAPVGGRYSVGAGNRRLKALQLARKKGLIPKGYQVWVRFARKDELHEISLTENIMRVALHPVDEFEAFDRQARDGSSVAAIADRYGLTERQVRQRLALGKLAPEIRSAWRKGKIGQAQAEIFTLSDDHDLQRRAFKESVQANGYFSEYRAKEILRATRPAAESREFEFIGREAYLAAGGRLTENLFKDEALVEDPQILAALCTAKLDAICRALVDEEGWSWAGTDQNKHIFGTLDIIPFATPDEKALLTGKNKHGHDAWHAKRQVIERVSAMPEARARSGVLIWIDHDGTVAMSTLRLKPSAADNDATEVDDGLSIRSFAGNAEDDDDEEPTVAEPEIEHGLSKAMVERLSEQQGQAVAQCLVQDVDLALATTVAALTASYWGNPFKLRLEGSPARKPDHIDTAFTERLAACVQMDRHALLTELARAIGGALNITSTACSFDQKLAGARDELIGAMDTDAFQQAMLDAFNPEEFFTQAPGKIAKAAAIEARGEAIAGKKDELATAAATIARETGWLPAPLRTVHYDAPAGGSA